MGWADAWVASVKGTVTSTAQANSLIRSLISTSSSRFFVIDTSKLRSTATYVAAARGASDSWT
jgi:hypothetical protein